MRLYLRAAHHRTDVPLMGLEHYLELTSTDSDLRCGVRSLYRTLRRHQGAVAARLSTIQVLRASELSALGFVAWPRHPEVWN